MAGGQIRRPGGHCGRPALLARLPHGAAVCAAVHGAPGVGQQCLAGEVHPALPWTHCRSTDSSRHMVWARVRLLHYRALLNAAHPCTLDIQGHLFPALQRICTYKSRLLSFLLRISSGMDFGALKSPVACRRTWRSCLWATSLRLWTCTRIRLTFRQRASWLWACWVR